MIYNILSAKKDIPIIQHYDMHTLFLKTICALINPEGKNLFIELLRIHPVFPESATQWQLQQGFRPA